MKRKSYFFPLSEDFEKSTWVNNWMSRERFINNISLEDQNTQNIDRNSRSRRTEMTNVISILANSNKQDNHTDWVLHTQMIHTECSIRKEMSIHHRALHKVHGLHIHPHRVVHHHLVLQTSWLLQLLLQILPLLLPQPLRQHLLWILLRVRFQRSVSIFMSSNTYLLPQQLLLQRLLFLPWLLWQIQPHRLPWQRHLSWLHHRLLLLPLLLRPPLKTWKLCHDQRQQLFQRIYCVHWHRFS